MNDWLYRLELEKKKNSIYIKGNGIKAKKVFYILLQCRIPVCGFVDDGGEVLYGLPVVSMSSLDGKMVYVVNPEDICVQEELQDVFQNNIFTWRESQQCYECNAPLALSMLLSRCKSRDTVMVVNDGSKGFWENLSLTLGLKTVNYITVENGLDALYELCYLDIENLVVAVCVKELSEKINDVLQEIGLRRTINIINIYNSFSGHVTDRYAGFDWILGNTYNPEDEFPGFTLLQDQFSETISEAKKIVILGNSATDPLFYPQKSWPEYLAEKLDAAKKKYIIYNGAITDYSSTNELYKFIRDVLQISPDVVISYGGFIDFREYVELHPYINLNLMRAASMMEKKKKVVYGIADRRHPYLRWLENEQMMQVLCELYGIHFYGILQPWVGSERNGENTLLKEWYDNYWSVVFPQFTHLLENADEFKKNIRLDSKERGWLKDFTGIFSGMPIYELYYDSIHLNEKGNEMIAERVFREIFD